MSSRSYADIQESFNHLSTFDLFRLAAVIDRKLEDADRILDVKRQLKVGQLVQYFIPESNRLAVGKLLKLQRRTALIEDQEHGRQWEVIYPALDLRPEAVMPYGEGVILESSDRFFQAGDDVVFMDRYSQEQTGKIIALNQKTATVAYKGTQWRISYSSLKKLETDPQPMVSASDTASTGDVVKKTTEKVAVVEE